jgi:hypothetical protein
VSGISKCERYTQEDYRTYPKKFPIFVNTIQQSLLENDFFLIGFSANDPNFLNWVGWMRDYFGERLRKSIFLLGIDKPEACWEKFLDSRNITFIDITVCPQIFHTNRVNYDIENGDIALDNQNVEMRKTAKEIVGNALETVRTQLMSLFVAISFATLTSTFSENLPL